MTHIIVRSIQRNYKWYILTLTALTGAFAIAAPVISLSVLFEEISAELQLNLVQVGLIWSFGSFPGVFSSLFSGILGDKFGPRRVILIGTLLIALAGATRGLAPGFPSMLVTVAAIGFLTPLITTNGFKLSGI